MPDLFKNERGVFPILILVAIGVALVAGGSYVVKNNLVTTKGGQIVFNGGKDKNLSDAKIPAPENNTPNTPQPPKKAELSEKIAEYKPETGEPKFSITPPAGWVKGETGGKVKLTFEGPQEDKKEIGNGGYVSSAPNIQVTVEKAGDVKTLDEAIAFTKSQVSKISEVQIEMTVEKKTTLNGMETFYSEFILSLPNINYSQLREYLKKQGKTTSTEGIEATLNQSKARAASYLLLKDGYAIGLSGVALASFWDKRSPAILASFNSFKFLDDTKEDETAKTQTAISPTLTSTQSVTTSTGKPIDISGYDTVFGSKEELSWRNPYKLKPPIPFSMKEPLNWQKEVSSFTDKKSYSVEYEGDEESQTGKNGTIRKSRPIVSVSMIYNPNTDLETEIKKLKASTEGYKIISDKIGTFFGKDGFFTEGTYEDHKTGVISRSQVYKFYQNDYIISIAIGSMDSTWDKWRPAMKSIIDSFKFL